MTPDEAMTDIDPRAPGMNIEGVPAVVSRQQVVDMLGRRMTRILDYLVPRSALTWGRLTGVWPWSDANPAVGGRLVPDAMWDMATDPDLPTWIVQLGGHRFPLVEFMDDDDQ